MNEPLSCPSRTHGLRHGSIIALYCRDCSRIASGRTLKVQVYHRYLVIEGQALEILDDIEILPNAPFGEIDVIGDMNP